MKSCIEKSETNLYYAELLVKCLNFATSGERDRYADQLRRAVDSYYMSGMKNYADETMGHLTGNHTALYNDLVIVASSLGAPVTLENLDPWHGGYFNVIDKKIRLNRGWTPTQRIPALLHELGHSILHRNTLKTSDAVVNQGEVEAESTCFVVGRVLGLDFDICHKYMTPYLLDCKDVGGAVDKVHVAVNAILRELSEIRGEVAV